MKISTDTKKDEAADSYAKCAAETHYDLVDKANRGKPISH